MKKQVFVGLSIINKYLSYYERIEKMKIPLEYQRLKVPAPDFGFPAKDIESYGFNNGQSSAIVFKCIVPAQVAMPFDDPQSVIDSWHDSMPDNAGLIEVKNGKTNKGNRYIYFIVKHLLGGSSILKENEYTLNLNLEDSDGVYFINSSFVEKGIAGMRDTAVYELFSRKNPDIIDPFDGWTYDPYDPEFIKGFLMNLSENARFDEYFTNHPLSKARKFVKFVKDNN